MLDVDFPNRPFHFQICFTKMGNHLPFLKKTDRRANERKPLDKPSSVQEAASVTPSNAGPTTLEPHTHRPLDQGRLCSPPPTAANSRPVDVASGTEPREISYQDETKTLEAVEQSLVLQVEVGVPSVSATAPIMESQHINTSSVAVPSEDGTGRTKHSTRTKRKHRTATHKRQHGELS